MTGWRTLGRLVTCVLVAAAGAAAQAADDAQERARIAAERAAAESEFAQRQDECAQRFAVTACVEDARARQRDTLASLRRQSALLDEAERRRRAAERSAAIREKVSAQESLERDTAAPPPDAPTLRPSVSRSGRGAPVAPQAAKVLEAERAAQEARSRARFDARQRAAELHREEVQRRADERARQGKRPAAPLPPASGPP